MVENPIGGVVVGVRRLLDVERFHPIADGDMGDSDYAFDFAVAQPFEIQLQRLGNIVVVYFFADFVNGKKVVAFFAKISLFAVNDAAFCDLVPLAFRAG
jgi:hypothetical protein